MKPIRGSVPPTSATASARASAASPFGDLIADLKRGSVEGAAPASFRHGAFDQRAEGLRRDAARMAPSKPDASEIVVVFEEDARGALRVVRHYVPPSPLARLTDELMAATPPREATAEERREAREAAQRERALRDAERERRAYGRVCVEYRELHRHAAQQRANVDALAAELEAACGLERP